MRRNKFYQNANSFYYRDKYYIEDDPVEVEKPKIIIDIFEDKNNKEVDMNIVNEFNREMPLDPLIVEMSKKSLENKNQISQYPPKTPYPISQCPQCVKTPCPVLKCPQCTKTPCSDLKCPQCTKTPCPVLKCPQDGTKKPCPQKQLNYQEVPENKADPKVWGPQLWFSFHNGATKYPTNPSPIVKNNMKNFILGIPVILPCEKCKEHANQFIESNYDNLDNIVSSRENLFRFFFDFHNNANKKTNKPEMSYEDAKKLYNF